MIRRTLGQVAAMIGEAEIGLPEHGQIAIDGVSTDTRSIAPGSLFVPIRGARFNGHAFVRDAFDAGAAAALWSKDEPNPPAGMPIVYVDDTLVAIQRLARAYRGQLRVKVIGITGSNGKTSTKDILANLLATRFKTEKTFGNLNNHLGVPLTLLGLEEDTEMAVVEMGMSALGEISMLASIAQPDAAIITNVSEVHLGDLKTRANIVQAKLEIASGLREDGFLACNGDNPLLIDRMREVHLPSQVVIFGETDESALYPRSHHLDETGVYFSLPDPDSPTLFAPLHGKHQIINALGAIAVARHFGLTYEDVRRGLRQIELTGMRTEMIQHGSCTIVNDAYKSNPTSVRAALETLYALPSHRRKLVVLGDMVELGEESPELHRQIGSEVDPYRVDMLFTLGEMGALIAESALRRFPSEHVVACRDKETLIASLRSALTPGCIVLVKGSRGLKLEDVVEALLVEVSAR